MAANSGVTVRVTVNGAAKAKQMLAQYKDPEFSRRAQIGTVQGAEVVRRPLQREAARASSRMAKAVSIRQAQRNRPAAVVTFRPKIAWFRHFVIGGTRSHGPRRRKALRFRGRSGWVVVKRVRGVRPNPMIERVAHTYQRQIFDAMIKAIVKGVAR